MKRILILIVLMGLMVMSHFGWAAYKNTDTPIQFGGALTKTGDWLVVADKYYPPACWYDTTAALDSLKDTTYTSRVYVGGGQMRDLTIKYYVSSLDTFANADLRDTVTLQFQFSPDTLFATAWIWTYSIAAIAAEQTAYVTVKVHDTDSLSTYPGYNYVRCRAIYNFESDSVYGNYNANCVAYDVLTRHKPVTINTAYLPFWK